MSLGDKLKIWLLTSPVLVLAGRRSRRAALAGWEAVAVATALSKAVEAVVRRRRPGRRALHDRTTAGRRPSSFSFPSNHTTAAVAFATAAGATHPGTAWALGPLAGVVAVSRPAGGRHYPSDVIGGIVTGAVAAAIVHRVGNRAHRHGSSRNSGRSSTPVASAGPG